MVQQLFLSQIEQHFQNNHTENALKGFRQKIWQKLIEVGFPAKNHEDFRYVSLKELYRSSFGFPSQKIVDKSLFEDSIFPACKHSYLVFIDGCFSSHLSDISALPSQTLVLSLDEAMRSHANFLQHHFSRSLKEEKDPFTLMNFALHPRGAFFYLPPKLEVTTPLQILHITTGDEPMIVSPRLFFIVGAHSRIQGMTTTLSLQPGVSHFIIPTTEISLEEGADLNLIDDIEIDFASWYAGSIRATLKKQARFHSVSFTMGAKMVRQSYRVFLRGENSEANLSGLWALKGNHTAHVHAVVEHEAPHTRSMQRFKGVLDGVSQSSFEGKIFVRPEAQKTEAYQLNNNLILSQGAIANSKPNLEIFADDVKASHGATFSQLDQEQLFYLSTRGINESLSRQLLIAGYCREILEYVPNDFFKQKIGQQIENFMRLKA